MIATMKLSLRKTTPRENRDNPYFEVKEVPLTRSDNGEDSGIRALVNGDTNKIMGNVSQRYNVTTHREASELVKGFLDQIGLGYQTLGAKTSTAGSRYFETITFPEFTFNPNSLSNPSSALDAQGFAKDDLIPTITIRNSYDKTSPVAWDYGMYRLICTNGMAILQESQKLSYKHTQIVNPDRVRDNLLANLENSTLFFQNVVSRLNGEKGSGFLIDLLKANFSDSFKEKLIEQVTPFSKIDFKDDVDSQGRIIRSINSISTKESAYAIYNVVTDIATHEIGNRSIQDMVSRKIAKVFEIQAA